MAHPGPWDIVSNFNAYDCVRGAFWTAAFAGASYATAPAPTGRRFALGFGLLTGLTMGGLSMVQQRGGRLTGYLPNGTEPNEPSE